MARTNLGRIRTVFKGEWAAGTYVIDDVVLYAGSSYICIAIAGASNTPTDTAFWVKSVAGIDFAGTWDTTLTYKIDELVTFNSSTYIALTPHSGTQPTATGQTDWDIVAEGLNYQGIWLISVTYHKNDIVTYQGSSYVAISDNATFYTPTPAGNDGWALFAAGGPVADQTGNGGKILSTDGTSTSWIFKPDPLTKDVSFSLKTDQSLGKYEDITYEDRVVSNITYNGKKIISWRETDINSNLIKNYTIDNNGFVTSV